MNLIEFEKKFGTEKSCRDCLFSLKFKDGFVCEKCGHTKYWITKEYVYLCQSCRKHVHLTSGTIFQDTHIPISTWFRAIWWVTSQKNGTSALALQKILGFGSYKTAWTLLHKLRLAMVRPGRDKLSGEIEIDEAFIGGKQSGGKRGRGTDNKVLVAVAVEKDGNKTGRIRLGVIKDASSESLFKFIQNSVESGSTVITDGWKSYKGLTELGYNHKITERVKGEEDKMLPKAHLVISLLKRWIMGTLQGSVSDQHIAYYLDEYTFRFNRRTSSNRGMLFYRLLEQAVEMKPSTYNNIIDRKGD